MIRTESEKGHTEVTISGDLQVILRELHIIILQILKVFFTQGADILVLEEIVDTIDEFEASIINKNINSKGEKKDD